MKTRLNILSITLILLFILTSNNAGAEPIDRIVAVVNSEVITLHDLNTSLAPYRIQYGVTPAQLNSQQAKLAFQTQVLDDLITTRLIMNEAKKLNLDISSEEIDGWVTQQRSSRKMTEQQYKFAVEKQGVRWADYRQFIKENLLKYRLVRLKVASQIQITDERVNRIFNERYPQGVTEPEIEVSHVFIRIPSNATLIQKNQSYQTALKAKERLKAGEAFTLVATEMSEGPSAIRGGKIGRFRRTSLDATFAETAFSLEIGEISDIVQTNLGYHIIMVSDKKEIQVGDTDEVKATIKRELQEEEVTRRVDIWVAELRDDAFVDIRF